MDDVANSFAGTGRLRVLVPGLALALAAFAYRGLFGDAAGLPASGGFEQWFFTPEAGRALLPIAIALWMLARRRARLRALPDRAAPALAGALLAVGVGLFAFATRTGAQALLPLSLAANLLALAAAAKGRAGCGVALLPALILLFGSPLPAPLRDGIVWWLQVSSARGAAWLMQAAGAELVQRGVVIHRGDNAFTVIESCSGLRGIEILTLVALATRELCGASGLRSWIAVAAAPLLAYALNLLRIVLVVLFTPSASPEAMAAQGWDHTPQGVAVLAAGTALIYLLSHALSGAAGAPGAGQRSAAPPAPARRRALWAGALSVIALLAGVSLAPAHEAPAPAPPPLDLPLERAGWVGEDLPLDRLFLGQLQPGQVLHRRYRRDEGDLPPRIVDLLVGYEDGANRASHLFSPKVALPDHDWSFVEERPARIWLLGIDGRLAVAAHGSELALGYAWRVRDEGALRETWRASLELDAGPLRREPPRAVVRLLTPLANDGSVARDRAKRSLDRFVRDFREELSAL